MKETLVILCGWSRTQNSYSKLIKSAPSDVDVIVIPTQLVVSGGIIKSNDNVVNFLKANSLQNINLLGHSLGGAFSIEFARHNPSLIKKLYLVDSEGILAEDSMFSDFKNVLKTHAIHGRAKAKENSIALLRTLRRPRMHYRLAHHAHHASLEEEAREIKVPTVILWGERDNITPLWQGEKIKNLIPNSKLITLKNMDHDWILHNPEPFWSNFG